MLDLLRRRRSIRQFTEKAVEPEKVRRLLEAALLAPSSMGRKSVELVVVQDRKTLERLRACKAPGTVALATAPLAVVVVADTSRSDVWVEDAAVAAMLLQLEAESEGLGACWIQLRLRRSAEEPPRYSEEVVRALLGIPDHYGVLCALAVGYRNERKAPQDAVDFSRVHEGGFARAMR